MNSVSHAARPRRSNAKQIATITASQIAERRMHRRREAEQEQSEPIFPRAEEPADQHDEREAEHPVRMRRPQQRDGIRHPDVRGVADNDDHHRCNRQHAVAAQGIHGHREGLERQHADHTADHNRRRDLGRPREQQERQSLVKDRPEFQVVNVERGARRIFDDACGHLRCFDRNLPVRKTEGDHDEAERAADRKDRFGCHRKR